MTQGHINPPRRVLLIRPSALGDVCRTTPVLVSLRRAFPEARIDWLVQDTFAAAVEHHPDLSDVILFPRERLSRWLSPGTWGPIRRFLGLLRDRSYDLVLDCQGLARSGIFAAATGAPRRIGLANAAELGWLGLSEGVHAPRDLHAVERMLLVALAAGAEPVRDARLYSGEADRAYVRHELGLEPGRFVLLAPTTRWPGKLWPASKFAALAERLLSEGLTERVAFVGSGADRSRCTELTALGASDPRVTDLMGRTSVGQLMAVVEASSLVVACDSAPMHMAVGFDLPLVGLFGPTRVEQVGPYQRDRDVIQHVTPRDRIDHKDAASGRRLMDRITVEEVLAAARERLTGQHALRQRRASGLPGVAVVTSPSSPVTPSTGRS